MEAHPPGLPTEAPHPEAPGGRVPLPCKPEPSGPVWCFPTDEATKCSQQCWDPAHPAWQSLSLGSRDPGLCPSSSNSPHTLVRYPTTGSTRPRSVLLAMTEPSSRRRRAWAGRFCRSLVRAAVPKALKDRDRDRRRSAPAQSQSLSRPEPSAPFGYTRRLGDLQAVSPKSPGDLVLAS